MSPITVFTPLLTGSVTIPNRLAVPAMVTRLSAEDGFVNAPVIERYRRFVEGGAGLVVVEASSIHGQKSGPLLKISDDAFIPGFIKLTQACRDAGDGKVFLQIIHFLKVARSGWRQKVGDLDAQELEDLPAMFAAAARRAKDAGFDGVELHMAHAYTLSSMLSRLNKRRDRYGGSLENRLRLPSMVVEEVRREVGDFPVAVRFDADESIRRGYSTDDAAAFAIRFAELGVAYVSLSAGGKFEDAVYTEGKPLYPYTGYSGDRCMPGDNSPDAANIWMARAVRDALQRAGHNTPVLGTGKIGTIELAEQVLSDGSCDIVGMARGLLADPYMPMKHRAGRHEEIVKCIYCNVCKALDENFKTVTCYLWPKRATQAPRPADVGSCPIVWDEDAPVTVETSEADIRLQWPIPRGEPVGYDVLRSTDDGDYARLSSVVGRRLRDELAMSGHTYRYRVIPYDAAGRRGRPSNVVEAQVEQSVASKGRP